MTLSSQLNSAVSSAGALCHTDTRLIRKPSFSVCVVLGDELGFVKTELVGLTFSENIKVTHGRVCLCILLIYMLSYISI